MSFASPACLLFLIPWVALIVWLLMGQRHRVNVPFLELWSGPITGPTVKRTIQPPPAALVCVLAALLLMILGAAGPMIQSGAARLHVTLIVDRGIAMSSPTRREHLPDISADRVVVVPPWPGTNWREAPPSAIKTDALVEDAVAGALSSSADPVVVMTDHHLLREDSRIIQISPGPIPQNVDIVSASAIASPRPQVMVRIRNQSKLASCSLSVSSGGKSVSKQIALPALDAEANVFVDLPALGDTIQVTLDAPDDLPADNTAWLIRQRTWPRIEVRSEIPAELGRMVEVYQKHRPPSESSTRVALVSNLFALPANEPAVAILPQGSSAKPTSGRVAIEFGDHPVIANVDWRQVVKAAVAAQSPGDGWNVLVSCGTQVLVAVREQPVREVWVGFNSVSFPKSKDFVIFWTSVFDWLGQGSDEFTSEPVHQLGSEWKLETSAASEKFDIPPGVYRRGDGARVALNATDVRFTPQMQTDWQHQLGSLSRTHAGGFDVRPTILLISLLLILAASLLWKRTHSITA